MECIPQAIFLLGYFSVKYNIWYIIFMAIIISILLRWLLFYFNSWWEIGQVSKFCNLVFSMVNYNFISYLSEKENAMKSLNSFFQIDE